MSACSSTAFTGTRRTLASKTSSRSAQQQVVYVHINDAVAGVDVDEQLDDVRRLPGATGVIDLVGFLQALDRIGYDGPVAVEPFDVSLAALPTAERVRLAAESVRGAFAAAQVSSAA